jgi:hypothetical protein
MTIKCTCSTAIPNTIFHGIIQLCFGGNANVYGKEVNTKVGIVILRVTIIYFF